MSKVNVHDFLMQNGKETQYAIVKYNINLGPRDLNFDFKIKDPY